MGSRGKILKDESSSKASRGWILKILKRKCSQEVSFSRASRGEIIKNNKINKRNDYQEDSQ
jgi:hypothetical protein